MNDHELDSYRIGQLENRTSKLEGELHREYLTRDALDLRYVMRKDVKEATIERRAWVTTAAYVLGGAGSLAAIVDLFVKVHP